MRIEAISRVHSNTENIYTYYQNTSLNFISKIRNRRRQVFILTATKDAGVVLIGNDYSLTFDTKNRIRQEEKLHNSVLRFQYTFGDLSNKIESTFHSHVISEIITSTDICTLLL